MARHAKKYHGQEYEVCNLRPNENTAEGIMNTAKSQSCDLIVMASHGYRGGEKTLARQRGHQGPYAQRAPCSDLSLGIARPGRSRSNGRAGVLAFTGSRSRAQGRDSQHRLTPAKQAQSYLLYCSNSRRFGQNSGGSVEADRLSSHLRHLSLVPHVTQRARASA